jgi:hypothetical protein
MMLIKLLQQFKQYHGMMLLLHATMVMFLKQNYTDGQELQHPQAKLPLLLYHLLHGEVLLSALLNN